MSAKSVNLMSTAFEACDERWEGNFEAVKISGNFSRD
jgi:hypothetical protein